MRPPLPTPKPEKPLAFLNARLIDPASGRDEIGGLLIKDGIIADIGPHLPSSTARATCCALA
jgi:dihydroorotase